MPSENESLLTRRRAIALLGGAGAGLTAGCGDSSPATAPTDPPEPPTGGAPTGGTTPLPTDDPAACRTAPDETIGPFPSLSDFVRRDIREGRQGASLELTIRVVDTGDECAPLEGAAVSIWQTDAAGDYSQYGAQQGQTFLRGVQLTDADGNARFTTIYPGWYQGRATHIHVEVSVNGQSVKVSQIAFPDDVSDQVHTSGVYASRGTNPTSNDSDGIFRDGYDAQLATVTGTPANGYEGTVELGVRL